MLQSAAECCRMLQNVTEMFFKHTHCACMQSFMCVYGVATISRIDKIIGLSCRISSLL